MIFSYKITHKLLVRISIAIIYIQIFKKAIGLTVYKKGNSHLEKKMLVRLQDTA